MNKEQLGSVFTFAENLLEPHVQKGLGAQSIENTKIKGTGGLP